MPFEAQAFVVANLPDPAASVVPYVPCGSPASTFPLWLQWGFGLPSGGCFCLWPGWGEGDWLAFAGLAQPGLGLAGLGWAGLGSAGLGSAGLSGQRRPRPAACPGPGRVGLDGPHLIPKATRGLAMGRASGCNLYATLLAATPNCEKIESEDIWPHPNYDKIVRIL